MRFFLGPPPKLNDPNYARDMENWLLRLVDELKRIEANLDATWFPTKSTDDLAEGTTNLYFTNERAQDAVGSIFLDTATINLTYDDATPSISADVIPGGIDHATLANLNSANYTHLTATNHTDLTDGGETTLHTHHGLGGIDAQYLVLTADAGLLNERVFTLGNGLDAVDSGAGAAYTVTVDETELNHNTLSNLTTGDVHTQYLLLAGRAGGQTAYGGTAANDALTFYATSHGTIPAGGGSTSRINLLHPVTMDARFIPALGEGATAYTGEYILARVDADKENQTGSITGVNFSSRAYSDDGAEGGFNYTSITALSGTAYLYEQATATAVTGMEFAGGSLSTGNITTFRACDLKTFGSGGTGVIGTAYGLQVRDMARWNTPTTVYAIGIAESTYGAGTCTLKYGLYIGNQTNATTNYSIYTAGGACLLNSGGTGVVPLSVRGASGQTDNLFQIQSSTPANLIEVDNNGYMGIGVNPVEKLHLLHSGAALSLRMDNYNTGDGNVIEFRRAKGTLGSEAQVVAGTDLFAINAYGWYSDASPGWSADERVAIVAESAESWDATNQGTRLDFYTTPSGSTTMALSARITPNHNFSIGTMGVTTSMVYGLHIGTTTAPTAVPGDSAALYSADARSQAGQSWWHGMGEKDSAYLLAGLRFTDASGLPSATGAHEGALEYNLADNMLYGYLEAAWHPLIVAGSTTNYTKCEDDGTLVFVGDATVWDDLRVSAETTKVGASAPDFDTFITGTKIYWFDAGTDQEVHFSVQLPHSWAGTAITPHVHWVPKTTSDGDPANQAVRWGLEYTWADHGVVFPAVNTIYAATHSPADADVVASKHYMSTFAAITPTTDQDDISSMIICRLFRDANDAADTYEADAGLLEIDFHYEIDTVGSRTITSK